MELVFDPNGFNALKNDCQQFKNDMQTVLNTAETFKSRIESSKWEGETKIEFLAFFDLVLQFHKKLLKDPVTFNSEEIAKQYELVADFLSSYVRYNTLE